VPGGQCRHHLVRELTDALTGGWVALNLKT
jgi:hypothetical protein